MPSGFSSTNNVATWNSVPGLFRPYSKVSWLPRHHYVVGSHSCSKSLNRIREDKERHVGPTPRSWACMTSRIGFIYIRRSIISIYKDRKTALVEHFWDLRTAYNNLLTDTKRRSWYRMELNKARTVLESFLAKIKLRSSVDANYFHFILVRVLVNLIEHWFAFTYINTRTFWFSFMFPDN